MIYSPPQIKKNLSLKELFAVNILNDISKCFYGFWESVAGKETWKNSFILPAAIGWRRKEFYSFLETNSQIFLGGLLLLRRILRLLYIVKGDCLAQGILSLFPAVQF